MDVASTHCHMEHLDRKMYQGIFSKQRPPPESIKLIWHTLITTLRAQYEQIDGTDDASELMRLNFRKRWCKTPMAVEIGVDIRWQYVVPRWLFPPPNR